MTQPSRTTETMNRDNEAIRTVMHEIRNLTVPDRATVAVGLIGHLATVMNRSQMAKLLTELEEEAERVQDVPPSRQRAPAREVGARQAVMTASGPLDDRMDVRGDGRQGTQHTGVGQAGRGEFRSRDLL